MYCIVSVFGLAIQSQYLIGQSSDGQDQSEAASDENIYTAFNTNNGVTPILYDMSSP